MEDPARLVELTVKSGADTIVCSVPPSAALLRLSRAMSIAVIYRGMRLTAGAPERTIGIRQFRQRWDDAPDGDTWAAAALRAVQRARRASPGICIADAERLLAPGGEPMIWHAACCYRRVLPAVETLVVTAGSGVIIVPVDAGALDGSLSPLDIQWELRDSVRVVARGSAVGQDSPPALAVFPRAPLHPDNFMGDARLRLRCFRKAMSASALASAPIPATAAAEGDVIVLRRRPAADPHGSASVAAGAGPLPGPVQLSAQGPEIARFEVTVRFELPVSCELHRDPPTPIQVQDTVVSAVVHNRTAADIRGELRMTLHGPGGSARSLAVESLSLPAGGSQASPSPVELDLLDPGVSYVMAGFRSPAGIDINAVLLCRPASDGPVVAYRNTRRAAVAFWDTANRSQRPARVDLDGMEEKIIKADLPCEAADDAAPAWFEGWVENLDTAVVDLGASLASVEVLVSSPGESQQDDRQAGPAVPVAHDRLYIERGGGGLVICRWILPSPGSHDRSGQPTRRLVLPLPHGSFERIRWRRLAFWDSYPRGHPDAPDGEASLSEKVTRLERAHLMGGAQGLCILTKGPGAGIDLSVSSTQLRVGPSDRPRGRSKHTVEFGFLPCADIEGGPEIWLQKPPWVEAFSSGIKRAGRLPRRAARGRGPGPRHPGSHEGP